MKSNPFSRNALVGYCLTLLAVLVIVQMVRIQTSAGGKALTDEGNNYYTIIHETIFPERGNIFDRWGHLMAGNREVFEVGLDLVSITDKATIAKDVSAVLGLDYGEVIKAVNMPYERGKLEYYPLATSVDPDKIQQLENMEKQYNDQMTSRKWAKGEIPPNLNGVVWRPRLQRTYPEKTIASNLIGFVGFRDPKGGGAYFGIEQQYNDLLAGNPIEADIPVNPNMIQQMPKIPPGVSLVLTIDRQIQVTMEKILDKAVASSGSKSGTIIVSDPKTGEILAIATTPRLDLNEYWKLKDVFPKGTPFDRAVGDTYEPGSVFKVLTMAAALDSNTVKPDTPFLDTGVINVGGYNIYNWDRGAWGPQTMLGCMQHSLNVCLSWVAVQMGPSKFYSYLKAFGIGHRTNIDLADEVNFPLRVPGDQYWADVNLATNSFGQGVAVTPIQMITAINALANNGKMMAPHILKAYIQDGKQRDIQPAVIGQPIKAATAKTLTNMLTTSLEEEASSALVEGYHVAGKTGTAEIPSPDGYLSNLTNASFAGWGPSEDPQFVVYIWLEKPTTSIWGSVVAAPVFSEVAKELFTLMKIPPADAQQILAANP